MPNTLASSDAVKNYSRRAPNQARGHRVGKFIKRKVSSVSWGDELFDQIHAEAKSRGWSFARMVRHLCEASIDGVP